MQTPNYKSQVQHTHFYTNPQQFMQNFMPNTATQTLSLLNVMSKVEIYNNCANRKYIVAYNMLLKSL